MKTLILSIGLLLLYATSAAQNVGIGTSTPDARLQVTGRNITSTANPAILITDSATAAGGLLKFRNAGNTTGISLGLFSGNASNSQQYLDIRSDSIAIATFAGSGRLGVRTLSPQYPLDVNGDINSNGRLLFNNSSGNAGQVLTSNGASDPSWQNVAENYPAADRLMVPIVNTPLPGAITDQINFGSAHYNLNPSNFTVATNSITVASTGLYEIEGKIDCNTGNITTSGGLNPYVLLNLGTNLSGLIRNYSLIREQIDQDNISPSFNETIPFQIKIHLVAGTVLSLNANIFQYATGSNVRVSGGYFSMVKVN